MAIEGSLVTIVVLIIIVILVIVLLKFLFAVFLVMPYYPDDGIEQTVVITTWYQNHSI